MVAYRTRQKFCPLWRLNRHSSVRNWGKNIKSNSINDWNQKKAHTCTQHSITPHCSYCAHIYIYLQNMIIETSHRNEKKSETKKCSPSNNHFANQQSVWGRKYVDMNSCTMCQYNSLTLMSDVNWRTKRKKKQKEKKTYLKQYQISS